MSEIDQLYQELIIDHSKRPRNFGELEGANRAAHGHNPLCGDRIHLALRVDDETITDARFTGDGCAICMASSSMMTDAARGRAESEVISLFEAFHKLVTGEVELDEVAGMLGKLAAFAGVKKYPIRVKCASLAWHTLKAALDGAELATTE